MNRLFVVILLVSALAFAQAHEKKHLLKKRGSQIRLNIDPSKLTVRPSSTDDCAVSPCAAAAPKVTVVPATACISGPCGTTKIPLSITTVASDLGSLSDSNVDAIIKKYKVEATSKDVKPVVSDSDVDHLTRDLGEIDDVKIVKKVSKGNKDKVAQAAKKEAERILARAARKSSENSTSASSAALSTVDSRLTSIESQLTALRAAVDSQSDRLASSSNNDGQPSSGFNTSDVARIVEDVAAVVSERVISTLSADAAAKVFARVEDKIEAVEAANQKTMQTVAVEAAKVAVAQITKRPTGSRLEREGVIEAAVNAAISETIAEAQRRNATSGDPLLEVLRIAAFKAADRVSNRAEMVAPVNSKPTQKEMEKEEKLTKKKVPQVVELAIQRTLADSREKGLSLSEAVKEVANLAARTAAVEARQAARKVRRNEKKLSKIETRAIKAAAGNMTESSAASTADAVKAAVADVVQNSLRKEIATDVAVAMGKDPQEVLANVTAVAAALNGTDSFNSTSLFQLLEDIKAAQSLSFIEEDVHSADV